MPSVRALCLACLARSARQVNEVTVLINQLSEGGQFPGADPCAVHNFNNDTEVFYYDDSRVNFRGPVLLSLPPSLVGIGMLRAAIYVSPSFCQQAESIAPIDPVRYYFRQRRVPPGLPPGRMESAQPPYPPSLFLPIITAKTAEITTFFLYHLCTPTLWFV